MCTITFEPIAEANWRATLALGVRPDQQDFVADFAPIAAIILAKAFIRPGGKLWQPYAIYADDVMIGLLALAFTHGSADDYWIYHFFIDQHYQGRGYGSKAFMAFLQLVADQHPACRSLYLTVHPDNDLAQRLYTKAGFQPTDTEPGSEPVYCYHMPDATEGAPPHGST